jgi:hypothetical protein
MSGAELLGGGLLGTLLVRLAADSSSLVKGMRESELAVSSGSTKMASQVKVFSTVIGGAFAAAGAAVAFFTKQSIDAADEIGKTAQKAGQAVEPFSALAGAANLSKVSAIELAQASKFLSQWMANTGKSTSDLTEELISQAEAFSKLADNDAKIVLAMERFGRAGAGMIPFLNRGAVAIRAMMEEQKLFGAVISKEFAHNAEEYNNNLTRINTAFRGVFNIVAEQLLPKWIEMQERFIAWIKETDAVHVAADLLIAAYDTLTFAVKGFGVGLLTVWSALKAFATIISTVVTVVMEIFENHVNIVVQLFGAWWDTIKGIISGLSTMADAAALAGKALSSAFSGHFADAATAAKAIPTAIAQGWGEASTAVEKGMQTAGGIIKDGVSRDFDLVKGLSKSAVGDLTGQWEVYVAAVDNLMKPVEVRAKAVLDNVSKAILENEKQARDIFNAGMPGKVPGSDQFTAQSDAIQKEQDDANKKLQILQAYHDNRIKMGEEMTAQELKIWQAYSDKVVALQFAQAQVILQSYAAAFDQLAGVFKQAQGEQSEAYKVMFAISKAFAIADATVKIAQGAAKALGEWSWPASLGVIAGILAQGAVIMSSIMAVQTTFGGKREMGGPVGPGQSFLVGEKGPEMFTPSSRGNIVPNNQLGRTTVNIHNYGGVQVETNEREDNTGKVIEVVLKRVKSDISSEIRDGRGDVNKSLEQSFGLRRGR